MTIETILVCMKGLCEVLVQLIMVLGIPLYLHRTSGIASASFISYNKL